MPVIVVGTDTPRGRVLAERLTARGGEVRAFVSDPDSHDPLRSIGAKVALGDLSDGSHLEGAALGAFCAIVLLEAAHDGRELAFSTPEAVADEWWNALDAAGVTRVISVGDDPPPDRFTETAHVPIEDRTDDEVMADVLRLEEAGSI